MSSFIKINVSGDLTKLKKELQQMMDDLICMPRPFSSVSRSWQPPTDIYEDHQFIYIVAEVPGVKHDSIEVLLDGRLLKLRGKRNSPVLLEGKRYYQMEIEYGPFERMIRIPQRVDTSKISARYENGLLIIRLGKHGAEPVKIEIR